MSPDKQSDPVEALRKVRAALFTDRPDEIAPLNEQAVVCTLWADQFCTLRDYLDMEIERAEAAGMVMVPKVATQAMTLAWAVKSPAFNGASAAHAHARDVWETMIEAASLAQQEKP